MNEKAKENYDKLLNEMQNIQPEYHYEYKNEVNSDSMMFVQFFKNLK